MRAMAMDSYGDTQVLRLAELPLPTLTDGQVLIRVRAAAVNPADGKWRSGMFRTMVPMPFPAVLGYDIAGEVVSGNGAEPGTRLVAMLDPVAKGGYAEYAAVDLNSAALIPDDMDFATAAAVPTAGLTGLQLIANAAEVTPGQTVAITGATGSVGRVALYYALQAGARAIAVVRSAHVEAARAAGADQAVPIGSDWTRGPIDCLIDTVGGPPAASLARHVSPGGRFITVATDPIPTEGLAVPPSFYAVRPSRADLERVISDVAQGRLPMPVAHRLPLEAAGQAQAMVEAGGLKGKVVLEP